jgi:hypothetical protein
MKHRDRVAAALNRQEPDRCPMQISFTPEFAERLRADMSMNEKVSGLSRAGHNPHGGGNTYELERALGEDMLLTSVGWANSYYQAGDTYTDEWGVTWKSAPYETPYETGHYTEITEHPLADLKERYGDRLCFWGTVDEQETLPFGNPEDVRREIRTRLRTVGKGGGLIIGPTHHVQLDTPMENFWAMIDTITETPY